MVDVLQLIKQHNRNRLEELERAILQVDQPKFLQAWENYGRQLRAQLMLEREYLYPEIGAVAKAAQATITYLDANLTQTESLANEMSEAAGQDDNGRKGLILSELKKLSEKYIERQEDKLIPLIRQSLSTDEREELSQVFQDALEEFFRAEQVECAV